MPFVAIDGALTCDAVSLEHLAREVGTPVHVYSAAMIRDAYRRLDAAFGAYPHRLHYAIKANATLAIVRLLRAEGARADANSGGEIDVALRAGFAPGDIVFTGVGKTPDELERAVSLGLDAINVESPGELNRLDAIATRLRTTVRVAIRLNPGVDAGTHPHITTGVLATKFGVSIDLAREMARELARRPALQLVGVHVHVGSQVTTTDPFAKSAATAASFARELSALGITLERIDVGGGLGIAYEPGQTVPTPEAYAERVLSAVRPTGLAIVVEPGRALVGPAGVLLTTVVDVKPAPGGGTFVICDAGMTDLARPALYGAFHRIDPVRPRSGAPKPADIVGPVCETTDVLGRGRVLPPVEPGDVLMVADTGAYGAVMASNYNRRPAAAEVMVDAGQWCVIRRRQTTAELLQWDI